MNSEIPGIPSLLSHILLSQVDQTLGHRSLNRLLRRAGLAESAGDLPAEDGGPSITVEGWSSLLADVYDVFGVEAARSVFLQTGRLAAVEVRHRQVPQRAITTTALRLLPVERRIRLVLEGFAQQSEEAFGTPHYLYEGPEGYEVEMPGCPHCAEISRRYAAQDRRLDRPFCHVATASLAETLEWALGWRCLVEEVSCIATGQPSCRFRFTP